jgi:hypothetical protein
MGRSPTRRTKLRAFLVAAAVLGLVASFATSSMAVHDTGTFELDKNASDDTSVLAVGYLSSNINATTTSINVCQTGAEPAADDTILIRAERMTVNANNAGNFGGNCAGEKRTYTVSRGVDGTSASSQSGGANNIGARVSLIVPEAKDGPDWDEIYAAWSADPETTCAALGLEECTFVEDGIGPTTFTGGNTKDHLPIEGWKHTSGASPDKGEILNAYAGKALDGDDEILLFGMDRYAVDGSTDIGFWFFQNPVEAITEGPDAGTFSGTHAIGDLLILGTFTQGGATSDIRVFKWVETGGDTSETLNFESSGSDCVPGTDGDTGCATVNDTTIEVPWNYTFKGESVGGWIPAGGFFEGGINLTQAGLDGCFSSFLAETRSSPSITAVLNDFALGTFEACDSGLTTTPSDGAGVALTDSNDNDLVDISIGTGTATVKDAADLDIKGVANWSGSLDFYLCGPSTNPELCSDTTGTKVGSTLPVDQDTPQPILSDPATVTSAGAYCWAAFFTSATEGVPDAADFSLGECFEVLPVTPTITTDADEQVEVGQAITDTATLLGTASQPNDPVINDVAGDPAGGTIVFRAYGPFDAPYDPEGEDPDVCVEANLVFTSDPVPVSGDGPYGSPEFTPAAAGYYEWVASYSGDLPNTLGVSGACGDANETSTVTPRQPTISTEATAGPVPLGSSIDDVATLGNTSPDPDGLPAGGTITFSAYGPFDNPDTCTGDAVYTSVVNVSGDGNYTASTGTGGEFTPTEPGTYNWIASYSGDAPNTLPVSGQCGDANESSVVIQLQPEMATAQSFVPNDAATITVADGGGDLAGTVVFKLYVNDETCSGTAAYTSDPIDVSTGSGSGQSRTVMSDNEESYSASGTTFHWVVEYTSTNTGHKNVTSPCGVEHSSITIVNDGTPN